MVVEYTKKKKTEYSFDNLVLTYAGYKFFNDKAIRRVVKK